MGQYPFHHFFADLGIGLGKTAFVLAVMVDFTGYAERLRYEIPIEYALLFSRPANDVNVELFLQGSRRRFPVVTQVLVINQAYQGFPALRGEEFYLKQADGKQGHGIDGFQQGKHQIGNGGMGLGEFGNKNGRFAVAFLEHHIMHFIVFVPQAKFGPHAIMGFWRGKNVDVAVIRILEQMFQALPFLFQLLLVVFRVDTCHVICF